MNELSSWRAIEAGIDRITRTAHRNNVTCSCKSSGSLDDLEEAFKKFYERNRVITLTGATGKNAFCVILSALGIVGGDEVILPTHTFFATSTHLLDLGVVPVYIDPLPGNGNIDPAKIRRNITPKTKAIMVSHMWGTPCDMVQIQDMCKEHGLKLIEDCSYANGAIVKNEEFSKKCGTFGDVAAWNLKIKDDRSNGHSAIALTNDREICCRMQRGENRCGRIPPHKIRNTGLGLNLRMHPQVAASLRMNLKTLRFLPQTFIYSEHALRTWKAAQFTDFVDLPKSKKRWPTSYWSAFVKQFKPDLCEMGMEKFFEMCAEGQLDLFPNAINHTIWENSGGERIVECYANGLIRSRGQTQDAHQKPKSKL